MTEQQEEARKAVRNIATAWNRVTEGHKMKKEQGFVGIGTFEKRVSGQYAVSDKELRKEKEYRKSVHRKELLERYSPSEKTINRIGKSFMQKPKGTARRTMNFGTTGYKQPKVL